MLDDAAHLIQEHSEDLRQLHGEWTEKYGLPKCSLSECTKTARHYERGRGGQKEQSEEDGDELYSFWQSIYDRNHHFVAHLYDVGLRVAAEECLEEKLGDDEQETDLLGCSVDKLFAAERQQIALRRKESRTRTNRFEKQNNKFMLDTVSEEKGASPDETESMFCSEHSAFLSVKSC